MVILIDIIPIGTSMLNNYHDNYHKTQKLSITFVLFYLFSMSLTKSKMVVVQKRK
jgi:hypothetical protein